MKLNSSSKGIGIQMVFFAISMSALVSGLAAFAQAQRLPPAFGQTVDELGSVTKPEHRLDDTANHYIPLSAHYGVSEAAYNVSTNNTNFTGHADSYVSTGPTEGDDDFDEMERYTDMIDYVDTRSQLVFEQYAQKLDYDDCSVGVNDEAKVNLSYSSTQVNVSAEPNRPLVNVTCQTPQINISTETELGKELSLNISNLRFHELASITVSTAKEMEDVSESLESSNKHYSSVTSSSACTYEENDYSPPSSSDAKKDAEDAAYSDAVSDAYNKVDDFEAAIVEKRHGYGGSDRGAKKVLEDATTSNAFCVFGYCLTKFWVDDISYDAYVRDNETSVTSDSNSSSPCGCADYDCNQDPDPSGGEYNYVGPTDICEHDDEIGPTAPSPECTAEDAVYSSGSCSRSSYPGGAPTVCSGSSYNFTTGNCNDGSDPCPADDGNNDNDWTYNAATATCTFNDILGSPSCSHNDFDFDSSTDQCVVDEADIPSGVTEDPEPSKSGRPEPQCVNKIYDAEATVDYEYERIEVQLNLTDDKFIIPTSDGFTNLYMNRKFIRNFEP